MERDHAHPQRRRPVSRAKVKRELTTLYRRAGYGGPVDLEWTDDLRRTHDRNWRRYAQVMPFLEVPKFQLAPQTVYLPGRNRNALLAHEVGHVLDPGGDEDDADAAARRALGIRIDYDRRWPGKGLQVARNPEDRVVCAWCQVVISEGTGGAVSHGMCKECHEPEMRKLKGTRENPSTGELAREAHRRWAADQDEDAFREWLHLRERLGLSREPSEFSSWEEIDRSDPDLDRAIVVQHARPGGKRKRMRVAEAENVVFAWLRARGWRPDPMARASAPNDVWISDGENNRATFRRAHVVFETGGRGSWSRDYRFHKWGDSLGTIDLADRLLRATRTKLARHVSDPYAKNPSDESYLPARIPTAEGSPPRRVSFALMAQGHAPLVYLPASVTKLTRERELARVGQALERMLTLPPDEGGLSTPDAWEDLLGAAGGATLFAVDRNGERWKVLKVGTDPGGFTGELLLLHQGPRGRHGPTWVDLGRAYGKLLPMVVYRGTAR